MSKVLKSSRRKARKVGKHLKRADSESNQESLTSDHESTPDSSENAKALKTSEWTCEEDDLLRKFFHLLGENQWQEISENIPGRSATQCKDRWTILLRSGPFQGRWTPEEVQKLVEWVKTNGTSNWAGCANFIKGRTNKQCLKKWLTANPDLKRGVWSIKETDRLIKLVGEYGSLWTKIATFLPGRSSQQCAQKWLNLNPNGNNGDWSKEEDKWLMQLFNEYGPSWSKIANFLPGRSMRAVNRRVCKIKDNKESMQGKKVLAKRGRVNEKETPLEDDDQNSESNDDVSVSSNHESSPQTSEDHEALKISEWTPEEDEHLCKLVSLLGKHEWEKIGEIIPGRSAVQCRHRWTRYLWSPPVKGKWTPKEDQKLLKWVKTNGTAKWADCATVIKGRSNSQCLQRWIRLNPKVRKGRWSKEETDLLFKLFDEYGPAWSRIAKLLPGRSRIQCLEKWFYMKQDLKKGNGNREEEKKMLVERDSVDEKDLSLDDDDDQKSESNDESYTSDDKLSADASEDAEVKKMGDWASEEDDVLCQFVPVFGEKQWHKISEHIPLRDSIQCRDRWRKILEPKLGKTHRTPMEQQKKKRASGLNNKKMLVERDKVDENKTPLADANQNRDCKETGEWTSKEDDLLCHYVPVFGERQWHKISENIPLRSSIQCRDRWRKILEPKLGKTHETPMEHQKKKQMNKKETSLGDSDQNPKFNPQPSPEVSGSTRASKTEEWTSEEDDLLCQFVPVFGEKQWHKISEHIPLRSSIQCRDRWMKYLESRIDQRHWTPIEHQKTQVFRLNENKKMLMERENVDEKETPLDHEKMLVEREKADEKETPLDHDDQNLKPNPQPSHDVSGKTRACKTEEWTSEEDDLLCKFFPVFGENQWQQIIENIIGRSFIQCRDRWKIILEFRSGIEQEKKQASSLNDMNILVETDKIDNTETPLSDIDQNPQPKPQPSISDQKLSPNTLPDPEAENTSEWTCEEDDHLRKFVHPLDESQWQEISANIPGRSFMQCTDRRHLLSIEDQQKQASTLNDKKMLVENEKVDEKETPLDDGNQSPESNHESCTSDHKLSLGASEDPGAQKTGKWASEEDDLLCKFVPVFGENRWQKISENIPGRSSIQCRDRWRITLESRSDQRDWTPIEDEKKQASTLNDKKMLVERERADEKEILLDDGNKNPKSNPELYTSVHKLSSDTSEDDEAQETGEWTSEEDDLLCQFVPVFGESQWQKISENLPGRSPIQCRDRWRITLESRSDQRDWAPIEHEQKQASSLNDNKMLVETDQVDNTETSLSDADQNPQSKPQPSISDHKLPPEVSENAKALKTSKWTSQEDGLLRKFFHLFGESQWQEISENIPGRSSAQCKNRWKNILQSGPFQGRWTAEEDQKLLKWVETNGACKWAQCSRFIKGRSGRQCRNRWVFSLNPDLKTGKWSKEEDELLMQLFHEYGPSWTKIIKFLPGRSGQQCFNRWHSWMKRGNWNKKKSRKKILMERDKVDEKETPLDDDDQNHESNHKSNTSDYELFLGFSEDDEAQETGEWTYEEDDLLCQFVPMFGENQWQKISENIPGRSSIECLHRWKKVEPKLDQRHSTPIEYQKQQASSLSDAKILIEIDKVDCEETPLDDGNQNPESSPQLSTLGDQPFPEASEGTGARKNGKWTSQEDDLLRKYVLIFGEKQWRKVSENIPGRNSIQCLHRWTKTLKSGEDKTLWTAQEDQKLLTWVKNNGTQKWEKCTQFLKGRSDQECMERWFYSLDRDTKHGNSSKEEDEDGKDVAPGDIRRDENRDNEFDQVVKKRKVD